jgi:hypothetical protein
MGQALPAREDSDSRAQAPTMDFESLACARWKHECHAVIIVKYRKRVGKPFIFIDARITQEASVRPMTIASLARSTYQALNNKS